ncbi:MAG: hypothetical protein IMZ52_03015 [Actinobacteria bacterium]|nr:hypothetical protein [Actinomycetota bacterium]
MKIQNYYPNCYQYNEDGDYKTYLGRKCEKLLFKGQHPASVKWLREGLKKKGFPSTLESDVLYNRRILIDLYDYFKPKEKINPTYAIIDIETDFPVSDDIISFAINNPDGDIYYESKFDVENPIELVLDLYEKIQEFDVLLAWMGEDRFDLKTIEKNFQRISKFINKILEGESYKGEEEIALYHLLIERGYLSSDDGYHASLGSKEFNPVLTESTVVLDLITISKKMHGREIRGNWSLDNAGKRLCGIAKSLDEDDMKLDVRELSEEKLRVYNVVDTIIPEVIDEFLGGLEGHLILAWSLQSMLEDMVIVAVVNDIALLRAYHRAGIVLPSREFTKDKSKKSTYEAAKPDAREGVYEGIITTDIIHAYPSAVIAKNTSPETKDPNGKHLTPKGTRFNDNKSVFIETLKELMKERAVIKKKLKSLSKEDNEYKKLKSIDFSIKTLIAAFSHGIFGWADSRMKDLETADAITAIVRGIIDKVKITCDLIGVKWCYVHTDSCYINAPKEDAERIVKHLNKAIAEHCKDYNIIPELEFKEYYSIGYIHSPARNVLVPEGISIDDDENWEESGMDYARSEVSEPIAEMEIEMIKMKLKHQDNKMVDRLKEMVKEIPNRPSSELALIKPLNKRVSEYGKKLLDGTIGNIPYHVKAMQLAHESYGLELVVKQKYGILPIITTQTIGKKKPKRKVVPIAFSIEDGLPKEYKIDMENYLRSNLFGKINMLFNLKVKELEDLVLDEETKKKLEII